MKAPPINLLHLLERGQERVAELVGQVVKHYGPIVQAGPFKGMKLPRQHAGSAYLPKLLGCYECEIAATIVELSAGQKVMNIGCGEGYYAIGMARMGREVWAVDSDHEAIRACLDNADMNGVTLPMGTAKVKPGDLPANSFILCDVEGGEEALLDVVAAPSLATCTIMVECHECLSPGVLHRLRERFAGSHNSTVFDHKGRNPNALPAVAGLNQLDQWLAVCEWRPGATPWLLLVPKGGAA